MLFYSLDKFRTHQLCSLPKPLSFVKTQIQPFSRFLAETRFREKSLEFFERKATSLEFWHSSNVHSAKQSIPSLARKKPLLVFVEDIETQKPIRQPIIKNGMLRIAPFPEKNELIR